MGRQALGGIPHVVMAHTVIRKEEVTAEIRMNSEGVMTNLADSQLQYAVTIGNSFRKSSPS
jgi:hypothetical protein